MENRIGRKDDEGLYQPKIHSRRIRGLYQIKELTGLPMTVLVDMAIAELLASYELLPKEIHEKLIGQNAKDLATLHFVSMQAQEAMMNPNLPESYKDEVVGPLSGPFKGLRKGRILIKPSR